MRLRAFNEVDVDVWPAFTDFVTSVLFILVIFVFGIFFSSITRSLVAEDSAIREMQARQKRVQQELLKIKGIQVPEADLNLQRIILQVDEAGAGGVLFARGQASLQPQGEQRLGDIVNVLVKNRDAYDTIQVEGHTDDFPINTALYPSNWELSAARAGAVVNYILKQQPQLEPWRFSANGRAEFRPYSVPEAMMDLAMVDKNPREGGTRLKYVIAANQILGADPRTDNPLSQHNRRIEIILTYKINPREEGDKRR
ncbi:MAG TPA: OmpA family protein [Blastocatellia bacterium]|jgi:outer membrane protein OmpA-like peptidoglycan-associated protein|nr:OmpA family protein [Blastocatellia bacterium]